MFGGSSFGGGGNNNNAFGGGGGGGFGGNTNNTFGGGGFGNKTTTSSFGGGGFGNNNNNNNNNNNSNSNNNVGIFGSSTSNNSSFGGGGWGNANSSNNSSFGFGGGNTAAANPNNDKILQGGPTDTVSSLTFNGAGGLAATAWDGTVTVWTADGKGKWKWKAPAPLLCSAWSKNNPSQLFFAGCDKKLYSWDANSSKVQTLGTHSQPIKTLNWVQALGGVVTGGWDKKLRYWSSDGKPVMEVALPERVYCMDVMQLCAVVGMAQRQIHIYDLQNPQAPYRTITSPLKYQNRCVGCFSDATGFVLGSIEGRCAVQHVSPAQQSKNFAFKCHRDNSRKQIFAVNAVSFHRLGTFATGGGDGTFNFWDKDSKSRLKLFAKMPHPVTAINFNPAGDLFAYATGYDWSKGVNRPAIPTNVYLHKVSPAEITPRKR